jgi:hypothetical protein
MPWLVNWVAHTVTLATVSSIDGQPSASVQGTSLSVTVNPWEPSSLWIPQLIGTLPFVLPHVRPS